MSDNPKAGNGKKRDRPGPVEIVLRSMRLRCPACGRGAMYESWYTLHERCGECGFEYEGSPGDHWAVFYITTAAIPGLFVLVVVFLPPPSSVFVRLLWLGGFVALLIGTLPWRKSLGIGMDYLGRLCWANPERGETEVDPD